MWITKYSHGTRGENIVVYRDIELLKNFLIKKKK